MSAFKRFDPENYCNKWKLGLKESLSANFKRKKCICEKLQN